MSPKDKEPKPARSRGGSNPDSLRETLAALRSVPGLDLESLRAQARELRAHKQRARIKRFGALMSVCILTWAIASSARPPQQFVRGTAVVDAIVIHADGTEVRRESFESASVGEPHAGLPEDAAIAPFVTNALAADGRKALLVTSSPAGNEKVRWDFPSEALRNSVLTYEASVYLDDSGRGGLIIGLIDDADQEADYDQAAVVFANGRCRTAPVERLVGLCEPRRWYRVKVEADFDTGEMSVWLDGELKRQHVPLGNAGGSLRTSPRQLQHFGIGGIYDGSDLEQTFAPLTALDRDMEGDSERVVFVLDGAIAGWRPTGLELQVGDRVQIVAEPSQEIRYAGSAGPARTNPDGFLLRADDSPGYRFVQSKRYEVPAPGAWFGSLVARVGSGNGFFVGSDAKFRVVEEGELFLAYNDNDASDNSGSFRVTVRVLTLERRKRK